MAKVILVGTSMGSLLALEFANNFPGLVEKVILLAPPTNTKEKKARQLFKYFYSLAEKYQRFGFFLKTILSFRIASYGLGFFLMKKFDKKMIDEYGVEGKRLTKPETWVPMGIESADFLTVKNLQKLCLPSLILAGDSDKFIDQPGLYSAVSANLKTELVILSKAGHVLHLEKPEAVAQKIESFLKIRN